MKRQSQGDIHALVQKKDTIEPKKKSIHLFSILQVFLRSRLYHEINNNFSLDDTDIVCVS